MHEIFIDIVGYEGLYQISNTGKVKSLPRGNGNGYRERILKYDVDKREHTTYHRATLSKDGKVRKYFVHQLVAQAFIPNPDNKPQVNHIDSNGLNNHVDNLEWCTTAENMVHSSNKGRQNEVRKLGGKAAAAIKTAKHNAHHQSMIGTIVGNLTIIGTRFDEALQKPRTKYICKCTCGNIVEKIPTNLFKKDRNPACPVCNFTSMKKTKIQSVLYRNIQMRKLVQRNDLYGTLQKTLTAFSNAIQLVKRKEYGGIVYFRTTIDDVEKAEEQGFRSGNDEKIAPFFGPVEDTLDFIARRRHSDSRLKGRDFEDFIAAERTELRERYHIEESTNLGLRGRTFNNIVAIIDEAQNYSKPALQKLLTRFGKDCKLILIGSQLQIDHPYDSRHTNGLSVIMAAATESHDLVRLHAVKLDKVLRSPLSEWAEYTFAKGKL